ncbi:hypothetical protein RND81_11G188400 [Saponaria officinalis]|uniref:Uncharacterized protein n=1 Tax=Saponaria officinalis TaxID=3572 RepID=A0AAW1HPG0_SAPOF
MSTEHHSKVKLISECFIRPKHDKGEPKSRPCLNLLAGDLIVLSMHYMQRGFLYSKKPTDTSEFLDKMKNSFSYALDYYYPLAGRFVTVKYEDEQACSIYVDPNKGPGARFIHASVGVSVSDIVSYSPDALPIVRSFFELGETGVVDYDGHTRALVSIQVTELDDGIFIGFTMNHSVADGTSLWHFINSLSEIFNSLDDNMVSATPKISHVPIFDPVLPEGYSRIQKLPYLELPKELISCADVDPQLRERIFHFSSSSIAKLKEQANWERGSGLGQISSFQALAAHVWISINRARNAAVEQMTTCFVPVDIRARLNPPLSSDRFGAMVHGVFITKKVGELFENGLAWTATQLHEAITAYDEKSVLATMKAIMDNPSVIPPDDYTTESNQMQKQSQVRFAGSMRFDVYQPDFN